MPKLRLKKPSKQNIWQFTLYNFGGVAFFVIGYLVFVGLYGLAHWPWWLAKIIADLVGWAVNYVIQRYLTFRKEVKNSQDRRLLKRFIGVSLLNVPLDYAIVGTLKLVGLTPFVGLWLSALFFTIWKYAWYKLYVFRKA